MFYSLAFALLMPENVTCMLHLFTIIKSGEMFKMWRVDVRPTQDSPLR